MSSLKCGLNKVHFVLIDIPNIDTFIYYIFKTVLLTFVHPEWLTLVS